MSSEFLGVGWANPLHLEKGDIAWARYEDSVRQSILIILGTAPGERVMRPDFGCGIHDLVFSVNSAGTAGSISRAVGQALLLWEPRIDLVDITVTPGDAGQVLFISIDYLVRATNSRFNLVYPFYLERNVA